MLDYRLALHPFRNAADVERIFQAELDSLPKINGQRAITEIGGLLIGPEEYDGDLSSPLISHVALPRAVLCVPYGWKALKRYSERCFPQVKLAVDAETNDLYSTISGHFVDDDSAPERRSVVFRVGDECEFNVDVWETFTQEDQQVLANMGFMADMSHNEWARLIRKVRKNADAVQYARSQNGDFFSLRELDVPCLKYGAVGVSNSYFHMPDWMAAILDVNRFVYPGMAVTLEREKNPYEIGSVHTHPDFLEMSSEQKYVASRLGEDVVRRSPSVADISHARASRARNSSISQSFRGRDSNTLESLLGIMTVNVSGNVTGSRYFDLGQIDQNVLVDVNDRAKIVINGDSQDYEVILEHYQMFDAISQTDLGTGLLAHVGGLRA